MEDELDREDKGLKRLEDAMEAGDIKKVCIHHRAMMSDLSYVKGIIMGATEREGWTEQQVNDLYESVRVKVVGVTKWAEQMLDKANVRAKKEWSKQFIAGTKKVQALAAQAHQYVTSEDWSKDDAE